jgi:hypothetical protein
VLAAAAGGLGNYTQSYDAVWGWADAGCMRKHVFMCKIRGGAAPAFLPPAPALPRALSPALSQLDAQPAALRLPTAAAAYCDGPRRTTSLTSYKASHPSPCCLQTPALSALRC